MFTYKFNKRTWFITSSQVDSTSAFHSFTLVYKRDSNFRNICTRTKYRRLRAATPSHLLVDTFDNNRVIVPKSKNSFHNLIYFCYTKKQNTQ